MVDEGLTTPDAVPLTKQKGRLLSEPPLLITSLQEAFAYW